MSLALSASKWKLYLAVSIFDTIYKKKKKNTHCKVMVTPESIIQKFCIVSSVCTDLFV